MRLAWKHSFIPSGRVTKRNCGTRKASPRTLRQSLRGTQSGLPDYLTGPKVSSVLSNMSKLILNPWLTRPQQHSVVSWPRLEKR